MIDKTALARRIRQLEGLTNEERSQLLELLSEQKRYGLVWENKEEDVELQLQDELPVLTEVVEKRLPVVDGAPNHILIEGDNLHALTCLSYTHENSIDVIYIDPPYNTGNKDFVYNDRYIDSEDSYRHSKWLSFMSKRLRIARRLLSDKGVIFISIDDNEQAALKLLCDEVFGERNFVTNFIWQSTPGSNTGNDIKTVTEYVMAYSKNKTFLQVNQMYTADDGKYNLSDEYSSKRGKYILNKLDRRMTGSHYSSALNYSIQIPNGPCIYPGGETTQQEHWNWRWSKTKLEWGIENGFIVFKQNNGKWAIYFKQYQFVDNNNEQISRALPYQNLIKDIDGLNAAHGTQEIMDLFHKKAFDYPKPISLILHLLKCGTHNNSIILDFFAGSGTTLHAVMQLNKEDGGHRQCILVTNNENGICENVTYERNKRVIQGYTTSKGEKIEGLKENNIRYYKTDYVPRERTQRNMRALVNAATDLLCIQNNLFIEQDFTIGGKKVRKDIARWFGDMLIVYREEFAEEIACEIAKMELDGKKLKVYIFSPGRYAFDDTFEEVQDKIELVALPAAIYDAYKRVLPKRKEKTFAETEKENIPTTLFG